MILLELSQHRFTRFVLLNIFIHLLNLKHFGVNVELILNSGITASCFGFSGAVVTRLVGSSFHHATMSKSAYCAFNFSFVVFLLGAKTLVRALDVV